MRRRGKPETAARAPWPIARLVRYRDFRLLWVGALFSFTGTWVQNVAQGWLVYDLTNDAAKLAWVGFAAMAPVALLGPVAGVISDTLNRRRVITIAQSIFAINALYLAAATTYGFVSYPQILVIAVINGCAGAVEMPARQSLISTVVPPEEVSAAVPVQAMTFNLARVLGPAVGGILLAQVGVGACYLVNGLSYTALIFAVLAIRADLRAVARERAPVLDLVTEGMRYTWQDRRLRTLFLMEAITSGFGVFYLSLMPAIARDQLGLDAKGLGHAMSAVGIGAVSALLLMLSLSSRPWKARIVQIAMTGVGIGLLGMAFARSPWVAFPLFAFVGAGTVMQFNTTNTLFQLIAPPALKGRVIAMHVWALSGLGPILLPLWGGVAERWGLTVALAAGGLVVCGGAFLGWMNRARLEGVDNLDRVGELGPVLAPG